MTEGELLRLIDEAAADGRTTLDLSGQDLDELPPEIGKLTKLKTLVLGRWDKKKSKRLGNNLKTLPDEIGQLTELRSLLLAYNRFEELPEVIGRLEKLRSLDLSTNQLSSLPEVIVRLEKLRSLDLSTNQLSSLPEVIVRLEKLRSLDLSTNQLSSLPEVIVQLSSLRSLNLDFNQLSSLPEVVGQLTNLRSLGLRSNKLISLPEIVGQLINLRSLDLAVNKLISLPEIVGQLINLRSLDLGFNQLIGLSEIVGQLTNLRSFDLSRNKLSSLPESFGQLTNLKSLDLSSNQLIGLPEIVGQLTNLQSLYLRSNQLRELPKIIDQLTDLMLLDLSDNHFNTLSLEVCNLKKLTFLTLGGNFLDQLPVELSHLLCLERISLGSAILLRGNYYHNARRAVSTSKQGNQFTHIPDCLLSLPNLQILDLSFNQLSQLSSNVQSIKSLEQIDLRGNPLPIPPEILGGNQLLSPPNKLDKIFSFYFQLQNEEGSVPLYEAKLILVGEGGAGKTSLAKKINSEDYELQDNEKSTEGIDVIRWDFPIPDGNTFRVNIWDFGGQEIYHATHQFFLTKRSLYLLVADTRAENTDFYYWLKIVELLSDSSPVLVIKNEKQDRQCDIDEGLFKSQFNNLKDYLPTNLKENRGIEKIKDAIRYHITQLPHVGNPLPKIWVRVRSALENYSQNCNTLTVDQYCDLCRQNGFTDKQQMLFLSSYLHDLGVCLHFQDDKILKRTVILKPEWATTAVYKVADSDIVRNNKGRFTEADTQKIWADSQYSELRDELLQLMMRFKLAYELPHQPGHYIAPQLLPVSKPKYDWNTTDNLVLRYSYDFMPKGILTRFIVETHPLIEDQNNLWKNGVVLADNWAQAQIIENYPKNEINVQVSGSNKKPLLEKIRYELWKIHESYERLQYEELIPCNCQQCKGNAKPESYSYDLLLKYIGDRRYDIECRASYEKVDVRRLISDITDQSTRYDLANLEREAGSLEEPFRQYLTQPSVYIDRSTHIQKTNSTHQYGSGDNVAQDKVGGDKINTQVNNQPDLAQLSHVLNTLLQDLEQDYNPNTPRGQANIQRDAIETIRQDPILHQRLGHVFNTNTEEALVRMTQHPLIKDILAGLKKTIGG